MVIFVLLQALSRTFLKRFGLLLVVAFLFKTFVKPRFYIWKREAIAQELSSGEATSDLSTFYFLGLIALYAVSELYFWDLNVPNQPKYHEVFYDLVLLAGIVICFIANKRHDGRNFLERFIAFSFPAFLRMQIVTFFVLLLLGITVVLAPNLTEGQPVLSSALNFLTDLPANLYWFWFVSAGIRLVRDQPR